MMTVLLARKTRRRERLLLKVLSENSKSRRIRALQVSTECCNEGEVSIKGVMKYLSNEFTFANIFFYCQLRSC